MGAGQNGVPVTAGGGAEPAAGELPGNIDGVASVQYWHPPAPAAGNDGGETTLVYDPSLMLTS